MWSWSLQVHTLVRDETTSLQAALTKLSSTVGSNEHESKGSAAGLEEKLRDSMRASEEKATKQRGVLAAAVVKVGTAHSEKSKSQDEVGILRHTAIPSCACCTILSDAKCPHPPPLQSYSWTNCAYCTILSDAKGFHPLMYS